MTLFDFARNNIVRDKRNYIFYFVNCTFSVFVFFLFTVLFYHPALTAIDTNSMMGQILLIAQGISILFSICFITYSVSCFLKVRSKQFGLITILGASKKQMNRLIFWENMLVGFAAIVSGILLGLVFSKLFLDVANRVADVKMFTFYFPLEAILITTVALTMMFLFVALLTPKFIKRKQVVELFKTEVVAEKRANPVPALVAFVPALALLMWMFLVPTDSARHAQNSSLSIVPAGIVLVTGTYLLFTLVNRLLQKRMSQKQMGTSLLVKGNYAGKNRSNTMSMTLSAILYAASFLAVIALFSLSRNIKEGVELTMPYAVIYSAWDRSGEEEKADVRTLDEIFSGLPNYQTMAITAPSIADYAGSRNILLPVSAYNDIMAFLGRDAIQLTDGEIYLVAVSASRAPKRVSAEMEQFLQENGYTLQVAGVGEKLIMVENMWDEVCVVSDAVFETLTFPESRTFHVYSYDDWEKSAEVDAKVSEALAAPLADYSIGVSRASHYYQVDKLQTNFTLYIGGMLCFTFILAVASFIYSRLYSGLEADCKRYRGVVKIGLSRRELAHVLRKEIRQIVLLPFLVALVYLWLGILWVETFVAVSNIPATIVCTILLCILQCAVYFGVVSAYQKNVFRNVYSEN